MGKQSGPLRVYHLTAHSGIQGAGVAVVTGNMWLGLLEWLAHTTIDEAKVRGGRLSPRRWPCTSSAKPSGWPASSCSQRSRLVRLSRSGGTDVRSGIFTRMVAVMSGKIERGALLVMCICVVLALIWMFWP